MRRTTPFNWRAHRPAFLIVLLTIGLSQTAGAATMTAECSPQMSPAEKATAQLCDQNVSCRRIADQYNSCPRLQSWYRSVAAADVTGITALDLQRGLTRERNPTLAPSESSVRLEDCLDGDFNVLSCRKYIGLAALRGDEKVADLDPATPEERQRLNALLAEGFAAEEESRAGLRHDAREAMAACEGAQRDARRRDQVCHDAQARYESCRASMEDWNARRGALLLDIESRRSDVGQTCPSSPIRGMPSTGSGMPTTDRWNCAVQALRTLQLPSCPGFLPNSFQTPLQALRQWDADDQATANPKAAQNRAAQQYTNGLFQQSVATAQSNANDPDAAARQAAEQQRKTQEMEEIRQRAAQRSAAIMSGAATVVTQTLASASTSPTVGPDSASAVVQQTAQLAQGGGAGIGSNIGVGGQAGPSQAQKSTQGGTSSTRNASDRIWVGTLSNCVTFQRLPAKPEDKYQYYSYTSHCLEDVKVCDPISYGHWGCKFGLAPGQTDKSWDAKGSVATNGGKFVACKEKENGKLVYFNEQAMSCYRSQ